jgi:type I restriction enzyme S subunit
MAADSLAESRPLHLPAGIDGLPSTWLWSRLDDACEGVFDCPHSTPKLVEAGPLVVRSQDIVTGVLRAEQAGHVSEDTYRERTSKAVPARGDLLYSREGTYFGIAAEVPEHTPLCLGQRMVLIRPKSDLLDFRFLRYWLNSLIMASHIHGYRDGSVAERLNLPTIRALPVVVPPLQEQRAIAHSLGTLEDKIALNRRMNETLEAMARALFKSWFVDFDPVRAKAEGRDPGLPQPLADLFPDCLEDSELGEIPKGWTVGALGDFLFQRVERCSASPETATRPYVPIDCISPKSLVLTESKPGVEAQSSLTKFYKGDVLFGAMRPYFHKVCIAPFDGTTRTTALVLYPRQADDFAFATLQLHHPETIYFATRHSTGSTIPYAVWTDSMNTMPIIAPPLDVRKAFNRMMEPVLLRIPEPYFENRSLAALRGTLLPKLISGELRVKDAETVIGSAR